MVDSTSSGVSQGTSTSTSGSYIPDYPQSSFLMSVAQQAKDMAGQMLAWGKDTYNSGKGLTDQIINEGKMFASPARIQQDMGMAEAGVAQAGEAGRQNALRDLQSYGIDPSSGRYAALDKAERAQTAAQQAGAGNLQRMKTEEIGRNMRLQGTQMSLQNEAIGANLMRIPNDYLSTASSLKYPPLGNKAQSQSQNTSNQSSKSSGGGDQNKQNAAQKGGGQQGGPGDHDNTGTGGVGGMGQKVADPYAGMQRRGSGLGGGSQAKIMQTGDYGGDDSGGYEGDNGYPSGDYYGAPGSDYQAAGTDYQEGEGWGADTSGGGGYGGGDYSGGDYYGSAGSDYSASDTGAYQSEYGGDYGSDYAEGGGVDPTATTGGFVSKSMSPSGGAEIDDVDANLNADEYVIPRDVALWKGQEFFAKLIAQSRKNLATAPHGEPHQDDMQEQPQAQPQAMAMG